jgi:hypothetical protein
VVAAPYFQQASTLGIYVHCAKLREVDTSPLLEAALQAGKRCFVPVVQDKASNMKLMHLGMCSVLSPVTSSRCGVVTATWPGLQLRLGMLCPQIQCQPCNQYLHMAYWSRQTHIVMAAHERMVRCALTRSLYRNQDGGPCYACTPATNLTCTVG